MVLGTSVRERTKIQREMLTTAAGLHLTRVGVLTLVVVLMIAGVLNLRTRLRTAQAEELIVQVIKAPAQQLPIEISGLLSYPDEALLILQDPKRLEQLVPAETLETALAINNIQHALAALGSRDVGWLEKNCQTAPLAQLPSFAASLRGHRDVVRVAWRDECVQQGSDEVRLRLALLLFLMDDESAFREIVDDPAAIDIHTRFIFDGMKEVSNFETFVNAWNRIIKKDDPDKVITTGLCQLTAAIERSRLPEDAQNQIEKELTSLYLGSQHGMVHSAAKAAMLRWDIPLPPLAPTTRPQTGFEWYVNAWGQTMIKLPGKDGFVAATETTVRQFQEYNYWKMHNAEDSDAALTDEMQSHVMYSPYLDCPAQFITVAEVLRYCNALSTVQGLQECYKKNDDGTWAFDPDADGYRLLTPKEWIDVCRAGTTTTYPFGKSANYGAEFIHHEDIAFAQAATHLPNRWGYFDALGNVAEFTAKVSVSNELEFFMSGLDSTSASNLAEHVPEEVSFLESGTSTRANIMGFRVYCPSAPAAKADPQQ